MSKTQAADYIGVCRATFDNYVHDGKIPKGVHISVLTLASKTTAGPKAPRGCLSSSLHKCCPLA